MSHTSDNQLNHNLASSATDFPLHPSFEIFASTPVKNKQSFDCCDFFFIHKQKIAFMTAHISHNNEQIAPYINSIKKKVQAEIPVDKIFAQVNNELYKLYAGNLVISMFLAILDLTTGELQYTNADYNPPFYHHKKLYRKILVHQDSALGCSENTTYQIHAFKMGPGDRMFLYANNILKVKNPTGKVYGKSHLKKILNQDLQSPEDTVRIIKKDVADFAGNAEIAEKISILELLYIGAPQDAIVFKADVENSDIVLSYIQKDMDNKNIPSEQQNNIMVVTAEIFANIAEHAYRSVGLLRIISTLKNGEYCLSFCDCGRPYNPLKRTDPDITQSAENRDIGGLGIFLIKKLTDDISYQYHNNQNILTIKIKI